MKRRKRQARRARTNAAETGRCALRIVYEDDDIIVVDKPAGLLTIATEREKLDTAYRTLTDHVRKSDARARIFIVHRLDRDTSGLLLFAKSAVVKRALQDHWHETVRERRYVAVVEGRVAGESGTIRSNLVQNRAYRMYSSKRTGEGKPAVTHFEVTAGNTLFTLLSIWLETGRKNQIRVHMQDIRHSIAGDRRYGATTNPIHRLALHAQILSFSHPRTGRVLRFESPVPPAFLRLIGSR